MNSVVAHGRYAPGVFSSLNAVLPLLVLPVIAACFRGSLTNWVFMWVMALAMFAGCKWLVYCHAYPNSADHSLRRALEFLLAWPGMDASRFLSKGTDGMKAERKEWIAAILKCITGALLTWQVSRVAMSQFPLLAGWIGMIGLMLLLHFGTFHLISLAWRRMGVNAPPLMRSPLRSRSVADFWGRRWNTAFHELTSRFAFRPLQSRIGASVAMVLVFLLSGLIHELVITFPAHGGYGLPTAYFAIQGLGLAAERSRLGRWIGLGHGMKGWMFAMLITAGPAYFLFPPVFIRQVILPMLKAIGAF